MNKMFTVVSVLLLLMALGFAQVTPIHDIQYTTDASGDSPLKGQTVTVEAIVSGESGSFGSNYYLQDSVGAWNGVMVYDKDHNARYGDKVRISATVDEYHNLTELKNVTEFTVLDSGLTPQATVVTSGEVGTGGTMEEAYEGVLVTIKDASITNADLGYGEWEIDDGSGACRVDDKADYFFLPANYSGVKSITGLMDYSYGDRKMQPRIAWDVEEAGNYTRIQRIQQVRKSDLVRAFTDEASDTSYARRDTVSVKGVVTMPTGLSFAGSGIKFIVSEMEGGPWSAILSYNPDSTAYPTLFEGDVIDMTGWIDEYQTGPSNMTEFWITSPINILDIGQPLPAPSQVSTGDLRLPETAEQWGNVFVDVKDATVVNYGTAYELFGLDDGTGYVLVDDDSDSLSTYYQNEALPPLGTIADSVSGWVYHHYGSYTDTTAYKLEPLYKESILWGSGPPVISNVMRDIDLPLSTDVVTISADIATNGTIADAKIYYDVFDGTTHSGYSSVAMAAGTGISFSGQIPATASGNLVSYYIVATDNKGQETMLPADIDVQNFTYKVTDGTLAIADVQYSPWEIADSPFEGVNVELTGVATTDTAANNKYGAYSIQDAAGAWNGIFVDGINANLNIGDNVTVFGTVTDYNPEWSFKWDNNTVILVDSFKINSSGNSMEAASVATGMLATDSSSAEAYEGVLVKIQNATLTSLNSYDCSFDDGSGVCLVDGDFMVSGDQNQNDVFYINKNEGYLMAFGDTVRLGEKVDMLQGVFTYSFGSYKMEVRNSDDFGHTVGINEDYKATPHTYRLAQNFPNPFNPETRIYFEIPGTQNVKIFIYNVLGQKVRSLVNDSFQAGNHIVNWDGRNDSGLRMPSGVYFYRIKAGNFVATKKMMMLK